MIQNLLTPLLMGLFLSMVVKLEVQIFHLNSPLHHLILQSIVSAPNYEAVIIQFMLYNPQLSVKVQPYPIVFPARQTQVTLSITVNAQDSNTNAQISGRVIIDGKDVGSTNTPITYTFQQKRVRVFDPDLRKWTFEVIYPEGKVTANGYFDTEIDFGF